MNAAGLTPDVTIGLPVRNGGEGLETAIQSLLDQTYRHFILLISDNASDDGGMTEAICRRHAAADPRVCYIRQPTDLGGAGNFRFTLLQARTPYFMWAAHDDVWAPDFIDKTRAMLEAKPEAAACAPRVRILQPGGGARLSADTFAITGTTPNRLRAFFWKIGDCSRFYALHRTAVLQASFPQDADVFGFDWLVCALSLAQGDHLEVGTVLLQRAGHAPGHYFRILLRHEPSLLDRIIPYRRLTILLRRHLPPEAWRASRWLILRLNLIQCLNFAAHRWPGLRRTVRTLSQAEAALRRRSNPRPAAAR